MKKSLGRVLWIQKAFYSKKSKTTLDSIMRHTKVNLAGKKAAVKSSTLDIISQLKTTNRCDKYLEKLPEEFAIPKELTEDYLGKVVRKSPRLLSQLTDVFSKQLFGASTLKGLRLKTLRDQIVFMGKLGYPFPDQLSINHWKQLLSYNGIEAMTLYFDAILDEKEGHLEVLEEIRKIDEKLSAPLTLPREVLDEVIGNSRELKRRLCMYTKCFEILQHNAEFVNPSPERHEFLHVFECESEEDMFNAFNYLARAHSERLERHIKSKIMELDKSCSLFGCDENSMDKLNYMRLAHAMSSDWSNTLVIDLDFADKMLYKQMGSFFLKYLPKVVMHSRECPEPSKLHLVNYRPSSMEKLCPDLQQSPVDVTEKCYLDLFPKERLVYLSPDSTNDLEYSPEDVYIIGGIVDNHRKNSWSLEKATKQGLRHAKFPFQKILGLECVLPVHFAAGVLLDYCQTRDWFYACRWVDPEIFRMVLKKTSKFTIKQEFVYLIQRKLHPTSFDSYNGALTPHQYRAKYTEYMNLAPDDGKLIVSDKYAQRGLDRANLLEFSKKYSDYIT